MEMPSTRFPQVVGDRLGKLRRLAYTIKVGADAREIARFERRGVRAINIPGKASQYPTIFETLFRELKDRWDRYTAEKNAELEQSPLAELALPKDATSRICSVIAPRDASAFYRSAIFPIIERRGFTPVAAEDLVVPGESIAAKLSALISRSELIILDVSTRSTMLEAGVVFSERRSEENVLVIMAPDSDLPLEWLSRMRLLRPKEILNDTEAEGFIQSIDNWLTAAQVRLQPQLRDEPGRLLKLKEYRAAIISAVALLENEIRADVTSSMQPTGTASFQTLSQLLKTASRLGVISPDENESLRTAIQLRNEVVHKGAPVVPSDASKSVNAVLTVLNRLRNMRNHG